ncbi:MAG: glycoside hydrolase family 20 zincin-like fold domain-containing protein, partial [Armatimonadota bacterium]
MKLSRLLCVLLLSVILYPAQSARVIISYNPASLNLVPFPKSVVGNNQRFVIGSRMVIMATDCLIARTLAADVQDELERTTGSVCVTKFVPQATGAPAFFALFPYGPKPQLVLPADIAQPGGYRLVVSSSSIVVGARTIEGMNYGTQTLRQLIRANVINNAVPGIS